MNHRYRFDSSNEIRNETQGKNFDRTYLKLSRFFFALTVHDWSFDAFNVANGWNFIYQA